MKIGFHLENLTFRGTTNAVKDYAHFNEALLDNESIFFYKKGLLDLNVDENCSKRNEVFKSVQDRYEIFEYSDIDDLEKKVKQHGCDYAYFLKSGFNDGVVLKDTKSLIHCVFNNYQPHGYKYLYVSSWLAREATKDDTLYIPHIVDVPRFNTEDFRIKLNIPKDKIVVGRYGGFDQFDIPFVKETIAYVVSNDPDFVFIFVNTRKFIDHPNVIFLNAIIDPQEKTNYITSCDAMIHARSDGESFGLSICEFLFHYKPVFSFGGGRDKNNVFMLDKYGLIYNNQYELLDKLFKLKYNFYNDDYRYEGIVQPFNPENVMNRFDELFLRD